MPLTQIKRYRTKRKDLIRFVLSTFSQRYEQSEVDSIYNLQIPVSEIREHLSKLTNTEYNSDSWIMTQLHRYERETGIKLFAHKNIGIENEDILLSIDNGADSFRQKHHLYTNQKIRIVNGVFDILQYTIGTPSDNLSTLYLGSGSLPATLADLLVHKISENGWRFRVYTHNIAVQERFLGPHINPNNIDFFLVGGPVDVDSYICVVENIASLVRNPIDFVVQSTNTIFNGELFVHSEAEARLKADILKKLGGIKILTLVKDEFAKSPDGLTPYGTLTDYDYIVTVPTKYNENNPADHYFRKHDDIFKPHIIHWSYNIFRVERAR